jgi:hypothetical protein
MKYSLISFFRIDTKDKTLRSNFQKNPFFCTRNENNNRKSIDIFFDSSFGSWNFEWFILAQTRLQRLAFILFGNNGVLCVKRDDFEKNLILTFLFLLLDQNEPKNQGFLIKLKRKFSHEFNFCTMRFILKASENVILSVIYFTSAA